MPTVVFTPEQAAEQLAGISVSTLIKLITAGGYSYTELSPGAKLWGRGRKLWGLTDQQIQAIVDGQCRKMQTPATIDPPQDNKRKPGRVVPGHDGKQRLRIRA